jgi:anti-anti-sigma factor
MNLEPAADGQVAFQQFHATTAAHGRAALAGEADVLSLDALRAALDHALVEGGPVVSLDLAELSFIDAAVLSELLHYQLLALARHQEFRVENASGNVAMVLEAFDLQPVLMHSKAEA